MPMISSDVTGLAVRLQNSRAGIARNDRMRTRLDGYRQSKEWEFEVSRSW